MSARTLATCSSMLGRDSVVSMVEVAVVEGSVVSEVLLSSEAGAFWETGLGLLVCMEESFFCRLPDCDCVFGELPRSSAISTSLLSSPMSGAGLFMAGEEDRSVLVFRSSLSGEDLSKLCCMSRPRGRRQRRLRVLRADNKHRMRRRLMSVISMLE